MENHGRYLKLQGIAGVIFDHTIDSLVAVCGGLLLLIMVITCSEVFARYFFGNPLQWTIEVSEYCLLLITFLGAAWVLKNSGHVNVDLVLSRLSPKTRDFVNKVTPVIGAIACLFIVWSGTQYTLYAAQKGLMEVRGISYFPKFILLSFIPLGWLLLAVQFLRETYRNWGSQKLLVNKIQMPNDKNH